ncbi:MAG: fatty acid desaturase [Pirellulales bacterium]
MLDHTGSAARFSMGQARGIVHDLFKPKLAVYWADFLLSSLAGGFCFVLVRRVFEPFTVPSVLAFVVCGLCYYRAVLFIHELIHQHDKRFRWFSITWNLMCGVPFLTPTFMYYTHVDHHMRKHFGTHDDGEYLPLGAQSPWHILVYLCQPFVLPAIAVVRFLILTPICWASPTARAFVHRRASSMVMDPNYIRPLPTRDTIRVIRVQEALCFMWCLGVATVLIAGIVPLRFLLTAYSLSVFILMLNAIRTLGAHRYTNTGGEMTFLDQLNDSINYPNRPFLSALWAPLGLRFHALHHVFPSMPYHNLDKAHRRLMCALPADSPYRGTESPSLTASIVQLWRTSRAASQEARRARHRQRVGTRSVSGAGQTLTGAH